MQNDWDCPCGQTNFARKVECSKCGKSREGITGAGRGGGRGIAASVVGSLPPTSRAAGPGVVPGAHYAGGTTGRTGYSGGYGSGSGGGSSAYGGGGGGGSGMGRAPIMARDWTCASCLNVNWGKRDACHKCGIKKPAELGDRTGLGGGFLERQDRVSSRRAGDDGGSEDEYDDFGRKKKKYRAGGGASAGAGAFAPAEDAVAGNDGRSHDRSSGGRDHERYSSTDDRESDRYDRRDRSRSRDGDRFGSRGGGVDDRSRRHDDRSDVPHGRRDDGGREGTGSYRRSDDDRRDWSRR